MQPNTREQKISKAMPCRFLTSQESVNLINEGWEGIWSFHMQNEEQWDQACDMVIKLKKEGWDVVLVNGQNEAERQDGVAYLYRKKII